MFGYTFENDIVKWEMAAWCFALLRMRSERDKQPFIDLTALGSCCLLNLGGALISAGERLRTRKMSGTAAAA